MILKPGRQPHINHNPQVQAYYCGLESRIGYQLLLGGTRHFGCYKHKLAASLGLLSGSYVLDAGCGVGHVALRLATKHGLRVEDIDIINHHLHKARLNFARSGLPKRQIAVQKMDYHHLEGVAAETLDGFYTSETFIFCILKRGGRLVMHKYDHDVPVDTLGFITHCALQINEFVGMPTNSLSHRGALQRMLEDAGFVDVTVQHYSENIKPIARLFYVLAFILYFINTVGGFAAYYYHIYWRYLAITATKPVPPVGGARND
ncbi:S-adenosyl-L-methionine-dependent methyltransferase [Aspergillus germanicus]